MNQSLLAANCPGKDLQGTLRRLVAGVARDIGRLPDRAEDRVHDIRVRMKKFRAALRLARAALGRREFAGSDKLARRLKDHFGSARDDDVLAELLLDLLDKPEAVSAGETLGLNGGATEIGADIEPARETCSALAAGVECFRLENLTGSEILEAWLESYRESREAMRCCRKEGACDSDFHEWRKRVKELLYQSATAGAPLDRFVPKTDRLASMLGTHHDLAMLTARLAGNLPGSKAERAALARKKFVARRALAMGSRLFAEKPSAVRRKIASA